MKESEWALLREHYATPYFFGSLALQQTQHVTIELSHVYRQTDHTFINILNEVRENRLTAESLALLNARVGVSLQLSKLSENSENSDYSENSDFPEKPLTAVFSFPFSVFRLSPSSLRSPSGIPP